MNQYKSGIPMNKSIGIDKSNAGDKSIAIIDPGTINNDLDVKSNNKSENLIAKRRNQIKAQQLLYNKQQLNNSVLPESNANADHQIDDEYEQMTLNTEKDVPFSNRIYERKGQQEKKPKGGLFAYST